MHAGQMRSLIVIEQVAEGQSNSGAVTEDWSTFVTARARRRKLSGREFYAASVVNLQESVEYRIRFVKNITTKMRINDSGEFLDIQSIIDPDEKQRELILVCERYE